MRLWKPSLSILTLLIFHATLQGQNLVPNGSFEEYVVCPGGYTMRPSEFRVPGWRSLTRGSPDYFNSCSGGEAAVPYNWAGVSDAYDGYGYVGIYTWLAIKDYREYLHCKLTEPLVRDSTYRIEFRYKLSSYSKYAVDRIALLLSDSLPTLTNDKPLRVAPTVSFVKDSALTPETGAWEVATAQYKARGGESFLTIGNFADNMSTHSYHIQFRPAQEPMLADAAYYYIDDVKVLGQFAESDEATEQLPVFAGGDPEFNTTYVLQNIQFEFNSYALMPDSYFDLENVVAYLKAHPEVQVDLYGHTDDVGGADYNEALSASRANSAADYLVSKGIHRNRITAIGYGESKPLIDGVTEKAREVNRRVEVKFH